MLTYQACGHALQAVDVGLPLASSRSCLLLPVVWRALHLDVPADDNDVGETAGEDEGEEEDDPPRWAVTLNHYTQSLGPLAAYYERTLQRPSPAELLRLLQAKQAPLRLRDIVPGLAGARGRCGSG